MASPVVTFKQMFSLMKRETHHHPEVRHFLAQETFASAPAWIDLDEEKHAEQLKGLKVSDDKGPDDQEAA